MLVLDQCVISLQWTYSLRFITKTVLIPLLIGYYLSSPVRVNKLFVGGLIMSFLGDVFLLFGWGFVAGLSCFLTTHILYILTFKPLLRYKNTAILPIILLFIFGLYIFLYENLGVMRIPVFLYAFTIGAMLYVALGTGQKWIMIGAILFVLSDSILAINLFHHRSTLGGMSIMLTYVLAQYCLTEGILIAEKSHKV